MTPVTNPLPPILPLATMENAWAEMDRIWAESARLWAERDRLRAESARLRAESRLVVINTAQALYGYDVAIDWVTRTCSPPAQ